MKFYRCDWCKKEAETCRHLRITGTGRPRPVCVDICEECFNKLFSEQINEWKKEDEERRKKYEKK